MPNVSIIVPTRNEGDNIKLLLERLSISLAESQQETEIIFVDDGSNDTTREEIRKYAGPLHVHLICRDDETGLATAVCAGAKAARGDLLIIMDADLSHPPEAIPDLLQPLVQGSHDMVIGSRYIPGGSTPEWPFARRLASRLATLPARLFTEVHDPLAGFFAVRREVLLSINGPVAGFKIGLEILASAGDWLRVTEIPITFADRTKGRSKMNARVMIDYLRHIAILGGLALDIVRKKELAMLAGTVVSLDLLVFHLLRTLGFGLDVVHIISFLLACNLGYLITASTTQTPLSYLRPSILLRYQFVLLLVLFLRGGMMSAMLSWFPDYAWLLSLTAAFYSLLASVAGYLYVSGKGNGTARPANWRLTALLIIFYTVLLRILYLGSYELIQEEAYYWNYSQHLAMGYLDHPPVVALLIWLGTHLFGQAELGVRFAAFICWFITAWFSYNLTRSVLGKKTAVNALVLIATLPIFFGTALVITPDAPLIACWAGALFFLHSALIDEHPQSWLGVGICFGIGMASKYTIALLGPAIILFMLIDPRSRRWFFKPHPYLAAITALLIFSPVILWNYQHEWASFLFQSQRRLASVFRFSTPELLGSLLLLLTPTGLYAIWTSSQLHHSQTADQSKVEDFDQRHRLLSICMALVPLSVFIFVSFSREVKLSWAGPLWLAFIPFMAASLPSREARIKNQLFGQRLWPRTLLALVLSYGVILHYFSLGVPGIPFDTNAFLFGGEDLALQVEQTVEKVATERGSRPLVVGMDKYRLASGLAFYRNKAEHSDNTQHATSVQETTGRQIFGMDALMYNYWLTPAEATGRDLLVISERKEYLADHLLAGSGQHLGKIKSYFTKKHGKEVGSYYYRLITRHAADHPSLPIPVVSNRTKNPHSVIDSI